MTEQLTVADVVGVYGIKGWVKIRPRTEDPTTLMQFSRVDAVPGPKMRGVEALPDIKVEQVRTQGRSVVARLSGIEDRDQAESLRGYRLVAAADQLPPAEEGEYYWRDLIGLSVWCRDGGDGEPQLIGRVKQLLETGANDVLVVEPTEDSVDDRERLLPWLPDEVVREVDVAAGVIHADWYLDV
jgi:16S rRNA processing protein RimM